MLSHSARLSLRTTLSRRGSLLSSRSTTITRHMSSIVSKDNVKGPCILPIFSPRTTKQTHASPSFNFSFHYGLYSCVCQKLTHLGG